MEWELRVYRIRDGSLGDFVSEWREHVLPLRRAAGFEVIGPWTGVGGEFVWLIGHDDLERADAAYYESPGRRAVEPDPARHIVGVQTWRLEPA